MKRVLIVAFKIALAAGLITWLVASGKLEFSELSDVGGRWPWLLAGFGLFGVVLFLAACRWRLLLQAQKIDNYSLHDIFALTLIGFFFSQVMIGTTGGDMVKAYVVAKEQEDRRSAAIISVLFDRALGLFVLLLVALVAIGFNLHAVLVERELASFALVVVLAFASAVLGAWLFYSDRIRSIDWLKRLYRRLPMLGLLSKIERTLYAYKSHPLVIRRCFAVSVALQVCAILSVACLGVALLEEALPIASVFFLVPVAHIAMALPINPPGALGTGEAIYSYLFERVGVAQGGLLALLVRCVYLGWAALGCVYYLQRKGKVEKAVEEAWRSEEHASPGDPHGDAASREPRQDDAATGARSPAESARLG